jgi:hypothetical protein
LVDQSRVRDFVGIWLGREGGREISNAQPFLTGLCAILGLDPPKPADFSNQSNDYVFERYVEREQGDGIVERGRIDLYKRDHFILEAKQSRLKGGNKALLEGQGDLFITDKSTNAEAHKFDAIMIRARKEAETYAQMLPADHAYPLFIIACDVGRAFEIFADFSGNGRHYSPFPNALDFRIEFSSLADPEIQQRLRLIWTDPQSLDPSKQSARVTREIVGSLAEVSKALEKRGFDAGAVALFLMRCLFTMFVEDVELIRKDSFKELLAKCCDNPARFPDEMRDLWKHMDVGDYSPAIGEWLLRFNGKLFKNADALPLSLAEIQLLHKAANANWKDLEPAIFGTLFEQALKLEERKSLGAHYTPRAYVERLVNATIMDALREDWSAAQSAAERSLRGGSRSIAIREIQDFLKDLASVRILDPACGTGNFLYVALRQMKQLEGEVLKRLSDLGGNDAVRAVKDNSVKPDQFLGMEVNRRAIEIAELVLWIGYLQWHLRTRTGRPEEPVLGDSDHILLRDALVTCDESGSNPTRPVWPSAHFIVGNPPFMAGKDIRRRRGNAYAEALWKANKAINPSADYVMYWWDRAAELLTEPNSKLRRFGFVTTNSIDQTFQRRVVERHLKASSPVSVITAYPHHPWTKADKHAAAVRITMTVVSAGSSSGTVWSVLDEKKLDTDEPLITFARQTGKINSDLTAGADITGVVEIRANANICSPGVKLHGAGFMVSPSVAIDLGLGTRRDLDKHIRPYCHGRDIMQRSRGLMVIDLDGLSAAQVRQSFPEVYQHLLRTVKPERDRNNEQYRRINWWLFGRRNTLYRGFTAGLARYIVTPETSKHRIFTFVDGNVIADNMVVNFGFDDAYFLGVLSSRIHVVWTLMQGATLEDRPRYTKSLCFDPFPFPAATEATKSRIRALAEELDRTRKDALLAHPELTLTTLYNVLDKLRTVSSLTEHEEAISAKARLLVIKDLHENIDAKVFDAYGWGRDISDAGIVELLSTLNAERSDEERRGLTRWLRPDYQIPLVGPLIHRADRIQEISIAASKRKVAFADEPRAQVAQVLQLLRRSDRPLTAKEITQSFQQGERTLQDVNEILSSLSRLGETRTYDNGLSYMLG